MTVMLPSTRAADRRRIPSSLPLESSVNSLRNCCYLHLGSISLRPASYRPGSRRLHPRCSVQLHRYHHCPARLIRLNRPTIQMIPTRMKSPMTGCPTST